jgi:short-subunit dehydrogenase
MSLSPGFLSLEETSKKNKTYAVITGATSGIGRAISLQLSKHKDLVALGIGRDQEALEKLKKLNPKKIDILQMDISDNVQRIKLLNFFKKDSKIKFLIHSAAMIEPTGSVANVKLEDWRYHLKVNLEAPIFLTQLLLPYLKDGRILHISSKLAHEPCIGLGVNCISKAALFMAYQCLRAELKPFDVFVGSLRPGAVDTKMQKKVRELPKKILPTQSQFKELKKQNKLFSPEEVAKFIEWVLTQTSNDLFCSDEWNIYNHLNLFCSQ